MLAFVQLDAGQSGCGETYRLTVGLYVLVGKTEPQRIFELLGRDGEVAQHSLRLRDAFGEALAAYRRQDWDEARAGFEACLAIAPGDVPSRLLIDRIAGFRVSPPCAHWNGVWSLTEK